MASEIKVDTVSEKTAANGVTIDGVNIKDSALVTAGSVPLSTIDIDGGTDIGEAIVDADLLIIDNGAGGTNRKTIASRLKTYIGSGLSTASQWRITANFDPANSSGADIASNWEVSDGSAYGSLGSAMTESSGIFTFPSTGVWYVVFNMFSNGANNTAQYQVGKIVTTTNNSSYAVAAQAAYSISDTNYWESCTIDAIIDVTNTTNVKVKFQQQSQSTSGNTTIVGSSSIQYTGATFIRLGDT